MTPLNLILSNSKVVIDKLEKNMEKESNSSAKNYSDLLRFHKNSYEMYKQIMYSAQILQFYNTNQIERMKINKGQLNIQENSSDRPEKFIKQVLQPFEYEISAKKMVVDISRESPINQGIKIDWRLYQLIIFNIIQNAIKYNKRKGKISITIALLDN